MIKRIILSIAVVFYVTTSFAQQKAGLTWKDVSKWNFNRGTGVAPNGQWIAWSAGPTEGDLQLFIKNTGDTTKFVYPLGAAPAQVVFSKDSKFAGFKVSAKEAEMKAAKKTNKPLFEKLMIVSLPGNEKVTFERVGSFAFSGENSNWLIIKFVPADNAPKGENVSKGTDALLYNLKTKKSFNIGNVGEFAFNKSGNSLVYTIDAANQNGNGVFLRDMASGLVSSLDNDTAVYKGINWTEVGDAFAVLKSVKDKKFKQDIVTALGFDKLNGDLTHKTTVSTADSTLFPKGMGITVNANAFWSEDKTKLFVGINKFEKVEKKEKDIKPTDSTTKVDKVKSAVVDKKDIEKPDMIIWNWQDKKLQSAQSVSESRDKNFSYLSVYHVDSKKVTVLADSVMKSVSVSPKELFAIGYDNSAYELMGNLDGQNYSDIYLIDLRTGGKKLLIKKYYLTPRGGFAISPNGKMATFYKDGVFYSMNLETGQEYNLTGKIDASFIDELDDHNVDKPATQSLGWTADSKYVLIKDNYDLWKIAADGKQVVALTKNWKAINQRVDGRNRIYLLEKGADLSKNQYFSVFNTTSKQAGMGILEAGRNEIKVLFMEDNAFGGLMKAENADKFFYTKENSQTSPVLYSSNRSDLANPVKLTSNTPDQEKYAWSSGVKIIDFVSDHGDKLQALLYLPANYEPGKSYPTITYIYERLTDNANRYTMPGFPGGGFNTSMYTSNGYAVLMPDIKYKLNDPGMSSVACVVPAVQAAINTGIVDSKNVAIHGHSWGGYQTSFLITQTNIFKAAAAGAPLTNMISMYSLIYWNSGSTNQAIFESSQGRLTPGYWDNWDAFTRNSPIYFIKNVQTPLLLLHNDKDGAVDYTQGIEYYNGLRRLNKPVVMITYKGENHGIAKLPNKKDYAVRMMEYFDHYLKGADAPDWWAKGIDKSDLEKHLESRAF